MKCYVPFFSRVVIKHRFYSLFAGNKSGDERHLPRGDRRDGVGSESWFGGGGTKCREIAECLRGRPRPGTSHHHGPVINNCYQRYDRRLAYLQECRSIYVR